MIYTKVCKIQAKEKLRIFIYRQVWRAAYHNRQEKYDEN